MVEYRIDRQFFAFDTDPRGSALDFPAPWPHVPTGAAVRRWYRAWGYELARHEARRAPWATRKRRRR